MDNRNDETIKIRYKLISMKIDGCQVTIGNKKRYLRWMKRYLLRIRNRNKWNSHLIIFILNIVLHTDLV